MDALWRVCRLINSISGIYSIESRIREIEKNMNAVLPDNNAASGMQSFAEILKDKQSINTNNSTAEIDGIIRECATKYGIDEKLLSLVAEAESGKNQNVVSNKGAIGVMQLMPDTAKGLGVNPYNIRENIEGGAMFLKDMLEMYNGNVEKALAAYNAGPGNVNKYNGIPPFKETQNYVNKIMREYK